MQRQAAALSVIMLTVLSASACQKKAMEMPAAPAASAAPMSPMSPTPMPQGGAVKYRIEFTSLWTKANFPFEYPDTSLIHKPHFSGLIGTAHNASVHLFQEGQLPTPGLERLSEQGKHDPLDAEIKAVIAAGGALALTESGPLKDFSQTVTAEVLVDEAHPMVSLVAMIAPSPDWFAAVADVNLNDMGSWMTSTTVDMMAWESGGDDGATYLADDRDNNPKKPTTLSRSRHFLKDGKPMPVARITFTRM